MGNNAYRVPYSPGEVQCYRLASAREEPDLPGAWLFRPTRMPSAVGGENGQRARGHGLFGEEARVRAWSSAWRARTQAQGQQGGDALAEHVVTIDVFTGNGLAGQRLFTFLHFMWW